MEKSKNFLAGAACLSVALVIAGWMLSAGIRHFKDSERVVTVKGLAEREVEADKVIWPLSYKEVGDDMLVLYNKIESTNAKIVEFLKSNGIAEEEITIAPAEVIDMQAQRYGPDRIRYRFNATAVITVISNDVARVMKLMSRQSDLLKQGVAIGGDDYRYQPQFLYTSSALNGIKPEMIEEATRNARASADKFARDSESRIGKIKQANQGQFSISDRDGNTPNVKTVRVVTTIEYYLKN